MSGKILTMKLLKERFGVCRLNSISTILTQKGISIFAISTYDTDYILVKDKDIDNAINTLSNEKYEIID